MNKVYFITAMLGLVAICVSVLARPKDPTAETRANKELLQRFYHEVYVNWNMNYADEVLSPNFLSHDWPKGTPSGPKAFRAYYDALRKAVPDAKYEVDDLVAERDRVVVRWTMKGTYSNQFPGIDVPPTGQPIALKGIAIYRVEKGKLAERWVVSDVYGLIKEAQQKAAKY
jgi:Predicted ester cyclase